MWGRPVLILIIAQQNGFVAHSTASSRFLDGHVPALAFPFPVSIFFASGQCVQVRGNYSILVRLSGLLSAVLRQFQPEVSTARAHPAGQANVLAAAHTPVQQ
jgi:hypothetical protein